MKGRMFNLMSAARLEIDQPSARRTDPARPPAHPIVHPPTGQIVLFL
jgi:hypothetical protein